MSLIVKPINLFDSVTVYDQTKTTYQGKITTKTLAGKTVVGPPIVKYRNTLLGPEAITPSEVVISANDRLFAVTAEVNGLITVAAYNLQSVNGDVTYIGKIVIQVPEPPTTTYAIRGLRVVDSGVTGWKIFLLVTANQVAHNGLYMVDNLDLADFTFVPPTFPTATAPSQKAVYKLDNNPFDLNNGTGLSIDVANSKLYVHRGLATTHSFIRYDYSTPITTVGALGVTTELFEYETGILPALIGTLLLTNSEEYTVPTTGPNAGQPCVIFHTSSTMYRGRLSDLTSGATLWPSLEFANNLGNINEFTSVTTIRAAYSESEQKVILLSSSSSTPATVIIKDFIENQHDIVCTVLSPDNNEAVSRDLYKFKSPLAFIGFDSKNGYLAAISGTTGTRGIYTAAFDVDDIFDSTSIISPVIDVKNEQIFRFTAGFVKPDFASPIVVCYRTSGFNSPDGGWVKAPDDLDFGGIASASGFIQVKITYKVFINDSTNGLQLYSAGLITRSRDVISNFWEYSQDDSTAGNPSRVAFRLKKQYSSTVPNLFFRAFDLSDNQYVQSTTSANPELFQYSTDGGVNWLSLGTIPNAVGTLIRYTFAVPPGIDVRPSLRED
jgi:hypothetical protein